MDAPNCRLPDSLADLGRKGGGRFVSVPHGLRLAEQQEHECDSHRNEDEYHS
jgi:hypothetical protein